MIEVHRHLGPGLLEAVYEECVCDELTSRGLAFERQRVIPLVYKGRALDAGYRIDLIVDGRVLVELKAVDALLPVHAAQIITYLRLSGIPVGLLVNFNVPALRHGIRRLWLD
jgi:GxxExxY protein